jgi:pyruvate-formate lyase
MDNVVGSKILREAKDHPGRHPGIVARVAGYCAYFEDRPVTVKQEIIHRTSHSENTFPFS